MAKIIFLVNSLANLGGVETRCKSMYNHLRKHYDCEVVELIPFLGFSNARSLNLFSIIRILVSLNKRLKSEPHSTIVISFSDLPNLVNTLLSRKSIISITGFAIPINSSSTSDSIYGSTF